MMTTSLREVLACLGKLGALGEGRVYHVARLLHDECGGDAYWVIKISPSDGGETLAVSLGAYCEACRIPITIPIEELKGLSDNPVITKRFMFLRKMEREAARRGGVEASNAFWFRRRLGR